MTGFAQAMVIARRDFTSVVMTPTFLLFLLAPLLTIVFGLIGGSTAQMASKQADTQERITAYVSADERAAFVAADARLRELAGPRRPPPTLLVRDLGAMSGDARAVMRAEADTLGMIVGPAARPQILVRDADAYAGRYLYALSEMVAREGGNAAQAEPMSRASYIVIASSKTARATQSGLGFGAVFVIFLLTLMLAGQSVSMLAEEKSNKVIEILAAAAPLESIFFGKLVGMLGVALLFVGFWGAIVAALATTAIGAMPGAAAQLLTIQPAVGWPMFLLLGLVYFLSAFLLLGAVFMGVGAQASTMREIQMLSLPITIFQVAMFSLSSAAANGAGSSIATIAQIIPWSSPFAMAARGATDASLWPHLLAIAWQALWLGITIAISVRMFRAGVLRSGPLRMPWSRAARQSELPQSY